MFDQYFGGINSGNPAQSLAVLDPAGTLNPNDDRDRQNFIRGVSTSHDSDIVLQTLQSDPTNPGTVRAGVTFRSTQAPGFGPPGSENETCTIWMVTYTLTQSEPGVFRIFRSEAQHQPC
jgi:hypothetical protein